jgi:archaellum component FlaC
MADIENLIPEHLRALRTGMDGLRDDVRDMKDRLGLVEINIASLHTQYASLSNRVDLRLDRIESRLELVE